jgi:CDP-glycerol glycerophosphotransferase (TagB/SpsB family)
MNIQKNEKLRKYRFVWLLNDDGPQRLKKFKLANPDLSKRTTFLKKNSIVGLFVFMRSKYVFHTHGVFWFSSPVRGQIIVNLWHGMPIKVIGAFDSNLPHHRLPLSTHTLATSPLMATIMGRALNVPPDKVLTVGLPRNQWLYEGGATNSITGSHKYVMWMPTYRSSYTGHIRRDADANAESIIAIEKLAYLDSLLEATDVRCILKLHPMDEANFISWPCYKRIFVVKSDNQIMSGEQLYHIAGRSEALITDYSSVAIDYLEVGKPIGLYAPDVDLYTRGFIPGMMDAMKKCTTHLKNIEDVANFIINSHEFNRLSQDNLLNTCDSRYASEKILLAVGIC